MSKIQPIHGHKVEKHHPEGENMRRNFYNTRKENGNYCAKILGKSDISKKKQGKKRKRHVWLSGRMHIEERRTIERRAAVSVES